MTTIINAVASTGLSQTADGSGIIKLQSNGVTTNALAWANFVGTATSGSATINASYNVSSVTINGAGDFSVNFANTLADANYCISVGASGISTGISILGAYRNGSTGAYVAPTSSGFRFNTCNTSQTASAVNGIVTVSVFGN